MGEKFISYDEHGVAESTLMLATMTGGHFYNLVQEDVDVDNGSVAVIGDYSSDDLWVAELPTKKDKVALILTSPKIYSEYTTKMQEESNFYNEAGDAMRAYEIFETDRFALSTKAFSDDAVPEVGQYVVVQDNADGDTATTDKYKLTTAGTTDPNAESIAYGFVGYIYKKSSNGNYLVFVKRNREVE